MTEKICAHCERPMSTTEWQFAVNEDVRRRCWTCQPCRTYVSEEQPLGVGHIVERVDFMKSIRQMAIKNWCKDAKEENEDMFGQSGYAMRVERNSLQEMQQMYAAKEALIPREEYDRLIDLDRKLLKDWMLIKRSDYANDLNRSAEAPMQLARMEADIGKLRAALGTRLFDEIVDGKKAGNQEPRGLGNQLIGRWNGPVR